MRSPWTLAAITLSSLALGLGLGGCASVSLPEPWVKPFERERLADPIMKPLRDPLAARHREHVLTVREAARGANGVQGGGCGCN
jgi:hypothetical protein